MQREYCILSHIDRIPVMVSINSNDYPEYLDAGYVVIFQGNKREVTALMEETEMAFAD